MRNRWEYAGTSSEISQQVISYLQNTLSRYPKIIQMAKSVFDSIEYEIWIRETFNNCAKFRTKNKLLLKVFDECANFSRLNIVELGVAYGDTTRFINKNLKIDFDYWGFDSFEGLERSWRGLPKGAFASEGAPLVESRDNKSTITFVKGYVEKTLPNFNSLNNILKTIWLFDLDLYAPTHLAFETLSKYMKPGDILYFDEAFDSDERLIIRESIIDKIEIEIIGYSPLALAFQLK